MSLKSSNHNIILGIIILIAAFLRFFSFFELPFMWDELSALHRLRFNSFTELIKNGVMPDGHPAGVQVFLFYWTNWFGDSEWIVKLPFNIMGLVSVYLIYKIARIWFSKESGLIAAAYAASLQFFVLYSPISRPYVSGLFLTLMMVLFWSKYMFSSPKRLYLAGFIIFAALSAYNHHFSLLFAAIVGISGLFFIPKNLVKEYIISGFLIFLLYAPHLPIFFHQLGVGGIGGEGLWLAKPEWSFIFDFFYWSFHFSTINIVIIALLAIITITICLRNNFYQKLPKITLLLIWFGLPLLIGLVYSIYINPVIQYSMLIFSFPYFLIFISIFASKLPKNFVFSIVIVLLSINSYQLIKERRHFEIILKQPFNSTAKLALEQTEKSFIVFNTIPEYQHYYFNKYKLDNQESFSLYKKDINAIQFDSVLSKRKEKNLITCGLPPEFENLARRHFPYLIKRENAYTMDCYVFSKSKPESEEVFSSQIELINFKNTSSRLKFNPQLVLQDSIGNFSFPINPENEWGPAFQDSLILYPENMILDIKAQFYIENESLSPLWVTSTHQNNNQLSWRGQQAEFLKSSNKNIVESYYSIDTRLLEIESSLDSLLIKSYLWNKNKNDLRIMKIEYSYREANPIKYSLFGKFQ